MRLLKLNRASQDADAKIGSTYSTEPRRKILHIIASFNPVIGGPAEAIRNIILEYRKLEIEAEVACLDNPDSLFLNHDGSKFGVHALDHVGKVWCYSPNLIAWLRQNLERFDVVIMHGLWLYPSFAVNEALRQVRSLQASMSDKIKKIPHFLIFPHGMLDPYFQRVSVRKLKAVRNWIYWKIIEHKVVNGADALLFTCETELLLARKTFRPYRPKREINIGYGIIDPPRFSAAMRAAFLEKIPQLEDQRYLLFLSRIHFKKGVDLLIKAYASILEEHADSLETVPRLVVAGPGLDSPYGETIKRMVLNNPLLRDTVYFPGMLTGDVKWGALYGCDAFSLPSHQENFGIAVAEALACEKPVLISNQVNIWREIEQHGSGIIADDSLAGTQQSLKQWLDLSGHEKQEMAKKARTTFEQCFQMSQVILRLNNVFESI